MWVRSLYGTVEHLSSLSPSPGCEEKDRLSLAKIATVRCVMQDHAPRWWSIRSTLQAERWCNSGTSICHRIVLSLDLPSGGQWSVICLCMRACMHACVRACVRACVCVCVCAWLHRCAEAPSRPTASDRSSFQFVCEVCSCCFHRAGDITHHQRFCPSSSLSPLH